MRLFSHLSEFLLCSFVTRKNQSAGTEIRDSNKALRTRSLCFRRCCLYAANSGTEQLAVHVSHATLLPQRSNILRSFSSFAANNNSRSYSAVFRGLLLLWFSIARVIRRQGRKGCVTQPQRACRAMRRQAGDMFERSESLTAQALATNSERQATKRPKNVACDL